MTTSPRFSRGDVVLVPFGFTSGAGSKRRPAIVVSATGYNRVTPDRIVASVTGNLGGLSHPGDHILADWQAAGLAKPSLAQTKLATVDAAVVGRRLGSLSRADLAAFDRGLRTALDLS